MFAEHISPERLAHYRSIALRLDVRTGSDFFDNRRRFERESGEHCLQCGVRLGVCFEIDTHQYLCEDCMTVRFVRGLLALIPDTPAAPVIVPVEHESEIHQVEQPAEVKKVRTCLCGRPEDEHDVRHPFQPRDPEAKSYAPETTVAATIADFRRTGKGVIQLEPGMKLDFRSLPAGTLVNFGKPKPAQETPQPTSVVASTPSPYQPPYMQREISDEGASLIIETIDHDLSKIPEGERELFEGGRKIAMRFSSPEDVSRYEQEYGDPAIMEALAAEDEEFFAEERRLHGDAYVDEMLRLTDNSKVAGIRRANGVGVVRTSKPKDSSAAIPQFESDFPSLATRRRDPADE